MKEIAKVAKQKTQPAKTRKYYAERQNKAASEKQNKLLAERREIVAKYLLQGYGPSAIKKRLIEAGFDISIKQVRSDMQRVRLTHQQDLAETVQTLYSDSVARLDNVIASLWDKYNTTDDWHYVKQIIDAETERNKLLGLYRGSDGYTPLEKRAGQHKEEQQESVLGMAEAVEVYEVAEGDQSNGD